MMTAVPWERIKYVSRDEFIREEITASGCDQQTAEDSYDLLMTESDAIID